MITGMPQRKTSVPQVKAVVGAMIFGEVSFAVVVAFLSGRIGGLSEGDQRLPWVLVGLLAILGTAFLVVFPLVRALLVRSAREKHAQMPDSKEAMESAVQSFVTATLVRSAMAEGFGLAGLVSLLVTGMPVFWAAPAISIAFLLTGMPSQSRLDDFVREVTGADSCSS